MIELKRLADNAHCVSEKDIQNLKRERKYNVIHNQLGSLGESWCCNVTYKNVQMIADKRTGSLYDPETMECFTGPLKLEEVCA